MCIFSRYKALLRTIAILVISMALSCCAQGAVVISVTPTAASFERNSRNGHYTVDVTMRTDVAAEVEAIGDLYIQYDLDVFAEVTSADITDLADAFLAFETKALDLNYATQGSKRTIHYVKLNTSGANWQMSPNTDYTLLRFRLFVRPDAVTGDTVLGFTDTLCHVMEGISHTDILSRVNPATYNIGLDTVAPITTLSVPAGTYMEPQNVRFSTNETGDGCLIYITTNNWSTQVTASEGALMPIPGIVGQVTGLTINYYAEDRAQDRPHNYSYISSQSAYVIDMQAPTVSVSAYTQTLCGVGDQFSITFTVSEALTSDPVVTIGDAALTRMSGSGTGPYVYRRVITGVEAPTGQVMISVRDMARPLGNEGVDLSVHADLDLGAPRFTILTVPDPVRAEESAQIDFISSEQLSGSPNVLLGTTVASWFAQDLSVPVYHYRVTASGYGWLLPSGTDSEPPYIYAQYPSPNSTHVAQDTVITFHISDTGSGVSLSSLFVNVRSAPAVRSGVVHPDFTGSIVSDGMGGYVVSVRPNGPLPPYKQIDVQISVCDLAPSSNLLSAYTYSFWTESGEGVAVLGQPVAIPSVFDPKNGGTELIYELSQDNDIELRIYDIAGSVVWQETYTAGEVGGREGLNRIEWEARVDASVFTSNGVYMFYIIDRSRADKTQVLGRGKVVVLKE